MADRWATDWEGVARLALRGLCARIHDAKIAPARRTHTATNLQDCNENALSQWEKHALIYANLQSRRNTARERVWRIHVYSRAANAVHAEPT